MKILYAIQATGNGHISRACQLMPYLQKYGSVDTILSGSNATLKTDFPVTYTSRGLSLFYRKCGGLHYGKMLVQNSLIRARKDAAALPVDKYDLIINDFDYITALSCRMKGVQSIQFGHQASFMSDDTPRPEYKSLMGEYILKNYARADHYVGLHFDKYDAHIFPPVIKDQIRYATPSDQGHITVYLPSYDRECLTHHFHELKEWNFQWFTHDVKSIHQDKNIQLHPISNNGFTRSLISCHGIITGGGFETPAEALYLKKKLMSIPIRSHYEQSCNAAALARLGCTVLPDIDPSFWTRQLKKWLNDPALDFDMEANDINNTLEHIIELNEGCSTQSNQSSHNLANP